MRHIEYLISYDGIFTREPLKKPSNIDFNELSKGIGNIPNRELFDVYIVGGIAEGIEDTKDIDVNVVPRHPHFNWCDVKPFLDDLTRYFICKKSLITDIFFFEDISFIRDWTKHPETINKVGYVGYSTYMEIVENRVIRFYTLEQYPLHYGLRVVPFTYPSVKNIQRGYTGKKILL